MKPPAIVAPEITEAEVVNRWDMATEREGRAEKTLAETRLEKGRILVQARTLYPAKGRTDGGWSKLLAKLRCPEQTARDYMKLAGYTDALPKDSHEVRGNTVPTYAEAGIVKDQRAHPVPVPVESTSTALAFPVGGAAGPILTPGIVSETWAEDMESLAEQMIRSARSMFSAAEQLDALCRQRQAAISSAKFASIPTHLLAAQASIASTLRIFKGELS